MKRKRRWRSLLRRGGARPNMRGCAFPIGAKVFTIRIHIW
jgi:hypothetical protein